MRLMCLFVAIVLRIWKQPNVSRLNKTTHFFSSTRTNFERNKCKMEIILVKLAAMNSICIQTLQYVRNDAVILYYSCAFSITFQSHTQWSMVFGVLPLQPLDGSVVINRRGELVFTLFLFTIIIGNYAMQLRVDIHRCQQWKCEKAWATKKERDRERGMRKKEKKCCQNQRFGHDRGCDRYSIFLANFCRDTSRFPSVQWQQQSKCEMTCRRQFKTITSN